MIKYWWFPQGSVLVLLLRNSLQTYIAKIARLPAFKRDSQKKSRKRVTLEAAPFPVLHLEMEAILQEIISVLNGKEATLILEYWRFQGSFFSSSFSSLSELKRSAILRNTGVGEGDSPSRDGKSPSWSSPRPPHRDMGTLPRRPLCHSQPTAETASVPTSR